MPTTHISPAKLSFDVVRQSKRVINSFVGYNGISVFWLAMIGGYILALALGASPWIALICGVGMGLSSFEVLYFSAGHNTKVQAMRTCRLCSRVSFGRTGGACSQVVPWRHLQRHYTFHPVTRR